MAQAAVPAPQRRSTNRRGVLERNAPEIVAILATGEQPSEVARLYGVDRSAITHFEDRHEADIAAMSAEVRRQVEDFAIASKVERIATLQRLADDVTAYLDDRGLMERTVTTTKDGATIERERFAREVAAELRAILKDAADELGQIPRPSDQINVNVAVGVQLVWQDGDQA